jgi:hypothetical protein
MLPPVHPLHPPTSLLRERRGYIKGSAPDANAHALASHTLRRSVRVCKVVPLTKENVHTRRPTK